MGGMRLFALGLCLLAGCSRGTPERTGPVLPDATTFHRHVLAVIATYPTDGTHGYWWPKDDPWMGNVRTLRYDGKVLAEGDPQGRCFCCGLTFEVFLQAWERWAQEAGVPGRIAGLDLEGARGLQKQWFGSPQDRSCLHTAIVANGLGRRLERWEDAQPGDFVQLWRRNGSGHSVVFLEWALRTGRCGDHVWSTQSSTHGIAPPHGVVRRLGRRAGPRRDLDLPRGSGVGSVRC